MNNELRSNILLVDDRDENLIALQSLLSDMNENLLIARSGKEALRQLMARDCAVILLDVQMPGMSGFETAALIRSRGKWAGTPIIFLTADGSDETKTFEGYRLGAVDFLHKPVVPEVLKAKVKVFVDLAKKTELLKRHTERLQEEIAARKRLEEAIKRSEASFRALIEHAPDGIGVQRHGHLVFGNPALTAYLGYDTGSDLVGPSISEIVDAEDRQAFDALLDRAARGASDAPMVELRLVRRDGSVVTAEVAAMPTVFDGEQSILLMLRDVTERKEMQARLLELARTDHLTGLLIRGAGEEALAREMSHATRYKSGLGFVLFDIDHFKQINDRHGHAGGDAALGEVGKIITEAIRKCDVAIRWGGEELLVLLPHTGEAGARVLAERVRTKVAKLEIDGGIRATVSAGVSELREGEDALAAISRADARLYQAKSEGRNRVV